MIRPGEANFRRCRLHRARLIIPVFLCALVLGACREPSAGRAGDQGSSPGPPKSTTPTTALPDLPEPRTNLALAAVSQADGVYLVAANGLASGKRSEDTKKSLWVLDPGADRWRVLPDLPVAEGRLASAATAIAGLAYVFGGYSVATDGSERSTPEVLAIDPRSGTVTRRAEMPIPVDDSVALPWRDRYVLLVSGWHDQGNVAAVQIYDTLSDRWQAATDFPGTPVFGHAGGLVGDELLICDGVTASRDAQGKATFVLTDACFRGRLDPLQIGQIHWQPVPAHPGRPRYRMAATGATRSPARVVFAGGSENPYNYNGIGYDGVPALASASVFSYEFGPAKWQVHAPTPAATMDHRSLIELEGQYQLIGGMRDPQAVSAKVVRFGLLPP